MVLWSHILIHNGEKPHQCKNVLSLNLDPQRGTLINVISVPHIWETKVTHVDTQWGKI